MAAEENNVAATNSGVDFSSAFATLKTFFDSILAVIKGLMESITDLVKGVQDSNDEDETKA